MDKKLKLKIITQGFYPDMNATGELLYELACELTNKHDVDIAVITARPGFVIKENLPARQDINGINVKRLITTRFNKNTLTGKVFNSWIFFIGALISALFAPKADYYLIVTSPPLAPLIGAFLLVLRRQKYIYLMHDIYPEIAWKLGYIKKHGIICKTWRCLTGISLKYADKTIVLSADMKREVLSRFKGLDEKKFAIIPNWANIEPVSRKDNPMLDEFNLRDKFIVQYSGNIGRIHEFKTFIYAAAELKLDRDIIFLFIGDGGKKQELTGMVKGHNLDNVMFLPYQKREDLAYSLAMGHVHLVSIDEGYEHLSAPSKLYGILAAGKPFIYAGNRNYISALAREYQCGYDINIGDYKKLAQTIKELKASPQTLEQMGKNSRKLFEEQYTLEKITNRYFEIIGDFKQ